MSHPPASQRASLASHTGQIVFCTSETRRITTQCYLPSFSRPYEWADGLGDNSELIPHRADFLSWWLTATRPNDHGVRQQPREWFPGLREVGACNALAFALLPPLVWWQVLAVCVLVRSLRPHLVSSGRLRVVCVDEGRRLVSLVLLYARRVFACLASMSLSPLFVSALL